MADDNFVGYVALDAYGVYADDDNTSCTPFERLKLRFEDDNAYTRHLAAKEFVDVLYQTEKNEEVKELLRFIPMFSKDPESYIKVEILEHLPNISHFCLERIDILGSNYADEYILPCIIRCLTDSNGQVRKSCQDSLIHLIQINIISADHFEHHLWHILYDITEHVNPDELRSEAVSLISKVAPYLGKDLSEKLVLPRFIDLCSDTLFNIRKVCASNFGEICSIVGREITESQLLPHFYALCEDNVWGVRKACAECAPEVSKYCSVESKWNGMSNAFYNLLTDQSRWVRVTAFQQLGPFIATFSDPNKSGFFVDDSGKIVRQAGFKPELPSTDVNIPAESTVSEEEDESHTPTEKDVTKSPSCISLDDVFFCPKPGRRSRTVSNSYEVTSDKQVRIRVDKSDDFISSNYWKIPVPDLNIAVDIVEGKATAVHFTTRVTDAVTNRVYTSEVDLALDDAANMAIQTNHAESEGVSRVSLMSSESIKTPSLSVTNIEDICSASDTSYFGLPTGDTSPIICRRHSRLSTSNSQSVDASKQSIVPSQLLTSFISMADPDKVQSVDSEITKHCAFCFPAVVLTLGAQYWPCLRNLYETLSQDLQWKVRRALAFSLHELVLMLGIEVTSIDIMPIFCELVRDVDEVKMGLVANLSSLCAQLNPELLSQVTSQIPELTRLENDRNWRYRRTLALELGEMATLLSCNEIDQHLVPLLWKLLSDKVAHVRRGAFVMAGKILKRFSDEKWLGLDLLIQSMITRLKESDSWINRQIFAFLCTHIVAVDALPFDTFSDTLLPKFLELVADDPIPNVRIASAKGLIQVLLPFDKFTSYNNPYLSFQSEILERLKTDKDRDVRQLLPLSDDDLTGDLAQPTSSWLPFRLLVREFGCDLAYTPMIMADSFRLSRKARDIEFTTCAEDRPLIVQFASKDPLELAEVSELVYKFSDGVDLNCGCPQRWAMQDGYGSAMLKSPQLIAEMVDAVRQRLPCYATDTNPRGFSVSVKIRLCSAGSESESLLKTVELCRQAEKSGVDWITLHCRTPAERSQPARWSVLKDVAQSVSCPVVLNGDVESWTNALAAHELSSCPGIMSARGLLTNPALFSGATQTPLSCVHRWLELITSHGLPFTLAQRHTGYMLEHRLSRADRRLLHALTSQTALMHFVQTIFPSDP